MKPKKLLTGISRAKGRRRCLSGFPLDPISGYTVDVLNRDLIFYFLLMYLLSEESEHSDAHERGVGVIMLGTARMECLHINEVFVKSVTIYCM